MSTITQEDDLARIDAVKRAHLMHHDPGCEHWRDVDALLHIVSLHGQETDALENSHSADLESVYREHRGELEELRAEHNSELEGVRADCKAEFEDIYREHRGEIENLNRELRDIKRRWDWLVEVARLFASKSGPEHRAMLERKLDSLITQAVE